MADVSPIGDIFEDLTVGRYVKTSEMSANDKNIAEALNLLADCNLRTAAEENVLADLVNTYFVCADGSDSEESDTSDSESVTSEEDIDVTFDRNESPVSEDAGPEDDKNENPLVTVNCDKLPSPLREQVASVHSSETEEGMQHDAYSFVCKCRLFDGNPCYTRFTTDEIVNCRMQMNEMTSGKTFYLHGPFSMKKVRPRMLYSGYRI